MSAIPPLAPGTTILAPAPHALIFPGPAPSTTPQQPLAPQRLNLSAVPKPSLGATIYPPAPSTLAGALVPPLAAFGASFLSAVLPTNRAPQVVGPFAQVPTTAPGQPTAPGENAFAARYSPQIYAVYVNGLIAGNAIPLAASRATPDVANPPISGDPSPELSGLPPVPTAQPPEGTTQVIQALQPLAGSGAIFSVTPPQGYARDGK